MRWPVKDGLIAQTGQSGTSPNSTRQQNITRAIQRVLTTKILGVDYQDGNELHDDQGIHERI